MIPVPEEIKTGIVALVGPPNVGKSTLLNTLLKQKISIVSNKPQTTRNRIMGIVNDEKYQIVFLDTPGIHEADSPLNIEMVKIAMGSLADVQAIAFMIDVTHRLPEKLTAVQKVLHKTDKPILLIINKIDKIGKETLLPILQTYEKIFPFTAMLPISALKSDGCNLVIEELLKILPTGERIFPEDIPTDVSERFIVSEMIREKIFRQTHQEVPYSTAVVIEMFQEQPKQVLIHATIMVERPTQKGIIIGKKGVMLARIGKQARLDIEELLGTKVVLKLWVKVVKDWTHRMTSLRELGF
jgi:GTP-binding protein Era